MERPGASITYKGSVSDAIAEARKQKKLFVVYISGDDENSTHLEQSTWVDDSVAESISRYCIFLHLMQGSIEALQFSAIYPQKSVPSITAVGYNGVMLWQHEGYITGENFGRSIEKVWAALHFQETAVTLLTTALTSKQPEPSNSSLQEVALEKISPSEIAATSSGQSAERLEDAASDDSKPLTEQMIHNDSTVETSSQSGLLDDAKVIGEEASRDNNNRGEGLRCETKNVHNASTCKNDVLTAEETVVHPESYREAPPVSMGQAVESDLNSSHITAVSKNEKPKIEEVAESTDHPKVIKSDDIHLNIRLPDGASLQRKFTISDTLKSVKNYIDENQAKGIGSYDLAVPYPRKVFTEQDMNSMLSDLGFAGRQALIVIPHRQATRSPRNMSLSNGSQSAGSMMQSTDDAGGYFGLLKRALSYINPFSYTGGIANSSNSETVPRDGYQQYRPDHSFQSRQLSGSESASRSFGSNQQNPLAGNAGETRRTSRPFGSNIHTLRHDEDDFQSGDRNTFWNGNSTQFGGDDKK